MGNCGSKQLVSVPTDDDIIAKRDETKHKPETLRIHTQDICETVEYGAQEYGTELDNETKETVPASNLENKLSCATQEVASCDECITVSSISDKSKNIRPASANSIGNTLTINVNDTINASAVNKINEISTQTSPLCIRFADETPAPSNVKPASPYVLRTFYKGMLKIERTRKFAAFVMPNTSSINSPVRATGADSERPAGAFARQPSRKITYLRNTLKKLSMMDVFADVPDDSDDDISPSAASLGGRGRVLSLGKPAAAVESNSHLLSLDSRNDFKTCDVCRNNNIHGLSCMCGHFLCTQCFCSRVRDMCAHPNMLRKHDFAIFCPVDGCRSKPWNSYHVRKLLDGPSLQTYLDALLQACIKGDGSTSVSCTGKNGDISSSSAAGDSGKGGGAGVSASGKSHGTAASPSKPPKSPARHAGTGPGWETPRYLVETSEMLRDQLRNLNVVPMEYIPLPEIQAELQDIFDRLNNDQPYDEQRMDFLLLCMESNPMYRAEKAELARQWREEMATFTSECLLTMRGFVPPHIAESTLETLTEKDGLTLELAKRLLTKKCLWLVRMRVVDIERVHEVDLMGRFNPIAQGLDIVELAAIFASVPEKFVFDPRGRKAQWRLNLENALREMDRQRQTNSLPASKARCPCYKRQPIAPFQHRHTMRRMEAVQSSLSEE